MKSDRRFIVSGSVARRVCAGLLIVAAFAAPAVIAADSPFVRVEEDWALLLNDPDNEVAAPQFHTVMSPVGDLDAHYALVTWNYREDYSYEGDFAPGGVQLQAWSSAGRLTRLSAGEGELSTGAELITWTQRLEADGVVLRFEVCDGQSETWGDFGDEMKITSSASYQNLNEYDPAVSAANSCITFGSNRVDALALMRVRKYRADGEVVVDNTPRIIYVADE